MSTNYIPTDPTARRAFLGQLSALAFVSLISANKVATATSDTEGASDEPDAGPVGESFSLEILTERMRALAAEVPRTPEHPASFLDRGLRIHQRTG